MIWFILIWFYIEFQIFTCPKKIAYSYLAPSPYLMHYSLMITYSQLTNKSAAIYTRPGKGLFKFLMQAYRFGSVDGDDDGSTA